MLAIILAAGKGTRMKSELPKPVVHLHGKPLTKHIIESFQKAGVNQIALVVGYKSDIVKKALGNDYLYVDQPDQRGTGHAIMQTKNVVDWKGKDIFIFVGDSPLIESGTIEKLYNHHKNTNADCTFLTAEFKMDLPYGRIIKDKNGRVVKCVEEKNASEEELKIRELLSSHFIFKGDSLFANLDYIQPDPDNNEYYLTDIVEIFIDKGLNVEMLKIDDYEELVGLNTPEDLAWAENILDKRQ